MIKPTIIGVLTGIGFLVSTCFVSANEAGFITTEKGTQYCTEDGRYVVDSWVQHTDSNWYHFDKEGYMQTAWYQDTDGTYYWLDEHGVMAHDATHTIQGKLCRFSSTGALQGTWQEDEKGWWYLEKDRVTYPADTWKLIDNNWYYFDKEGYRQTGWFDPASNTILTDTDSIDPGIQLYYLKETGIMACNETLPLDSEYLYTFDENGIFTAKTPAKTEAELELEQLASQIVNQLITENMSKREKATAIYKWVQSHIGYIATSDKSDWVAEAIRGLKTRRGDCFTYYAVSRAMLDAAGIENVPVYPKEGGHVHYWNIIYVEGGWYHFDTTPRKSGSTFCIVTNAQYDALSSARRTTRYLENGFDYPEMAEK